jgi:hypothetical protein
MFVYTVGSLDSASVKQAYAAGSAPLSGSSDPPRQRGLGQRYPCIINQNLNMRDLCYAVVTYYKAIC